MPMKPEELRRRTKAFAVRVVRLFQALPRTEESKIIGRQLLRSATSVAANYRAACRARSRAEFIAKIGTVREEADETLFWLEFLCDAGLFNASRLIPLIRECNELVALFTASRMTAEKNNRQSSIGDRQS